MLKPLSVQLLKENKVYLFLCRYPYIKRVPWWKRPFVKDKFDEILPSDEGRYKELERYVLVWLYQRGFYDTLSEEKGELKWSVQKPFTFVRPFLTSPTMNMRTLLDEEETRRLKGLLMDEMNDGRAATDLIQLIDTLISLYPERIINTIITKMYKGVSAIVTHTDQWEEWVAYHQHNPYVWMVIWWNVLMTRYGDLRAMSSVTIPPALQGLVPPDTSHTRSS